MLQLIYLSPGFLFFVFVCVFLCVYAYTVFLSFTEPTKTSCDDPGTPRYGSMNRTYGFKVKDVCPYI